MTFSEKFTTYVVPLARRYGMLAAGAALLVSLTANVVTLMRPEPPKEIRVVFMPARQGAETTSVESPTEDEVVALANAGETETEPATDSSAIDATAKPDKHTTKKKKKKKRSAAHRGPKVLSKVMINSANAAQLQHLPGVGPKMAEKIIAYRKANGPFKTVDELTNVSGIGPKKLEKMRPFVILR